MSRVFIWFANALSGICYLYLLCGAKSKNEGEEEVKKEAWRRERTLQWKERVNEQ
jgi:hypothetical protein